MIELIEVSKAYQSQFAVQDLNVTFKTGKITALLGPSGCGKTTTLRMINRLIEPTSGQILLHGKDTRTLKPEVLRRNMGYVIQRIGLFPHLSIARNVAVVPELLREPREKVQKRVDDLLELVGLDPVVYRNKKPAELSGGQQQRVGVARALAADPQVLLMDEPFGALDPIVREKLQQEFLSIQQKLSKTIVLVTHDLHEAIVLADDIALMHEGKLVQFGPPSALIHQPGGPFVRQFMGEDAVLTELALRAVRDLVQPGEASGLVSIEADHHLRTALSVMLRDRVDQLAVQDNGQTLGVLHLRDLITSVQRPR